MNTTDTRADYIAGLRALADLLDTTPELPLPDGINSAGVANWNVWSALHADVPAAVADLRRLMPPAVWAKNDPSTNGYSAKYYELTAPFHGLTLTLTAHRAEVCERVVTGTREVVEDVPVAFEKVTKTVEDVEWVCKPLLADA